MMVFVGIDDTDTKDSPGTNQVARTAVGELCSDFHCLRIVRHQLLLDSRVPYTSKNSCCSLLIQSKLPVAKAVWDLRDRLRGSLLCHFQPGSDPGLCLAMDVPAEVIEFGRRCQSDVTRQEEARKLAAKHEITLEGLGGSEDGVIGALAAVGLAATADDGRLVQIHQQPDDLSGLQSVALLHARGVDAVLCEDGHVTSGTVDLGKQQHSAQEPPQMAAVRLRQISANRLEQGR